MAASARRHGILSPLRQATLFVALAAMGAPVLHGQAGAGGAIVGRVSDDDGGVVPGVRVTAVGTGVRHEALTDRHGRFDLGPLNIGMYRVEMSLAGFMPVSGTVVLTPSIPRADLGWVLRIGCSEPGLRVVPTVAQAARRAEAVLHLRVTSDEGLVTWSARPDCAGVTMASYAVDTIESIPRPGRHDWSAPPRLLVPRRDARLTPGGEYIALIVSNGQADAELILPVHAGRIDGRVAAPLGGMRVPEALDLLREWSRDRGKLQ